MSALIFASWGGWMVGRAFDGLVALLLVGALSLLARRASPRLRSGLLWLALLPLVFPMPALPILPPPMAGFRIAAEELANLRTAPGSDPVAAGVAPMAPMAPAQREDASPTASPLGARAASSDATHAFPWSALVFAAWATIVVSLFARFAREEAAARRALARARPLSDGELGVDVTTLALECGLRRHVRVLESGELEAPAARGLLRPSIVLPPGLAGALRPEEMRFVLLHELSHLRRGDLWFAFVERIVRTFWFFHPTPWLVGRRLAIERELACDDAALSFVAPGERRSCAGAFLKVVEFSRSSSPAGVAGMTAALSSDARALRSRIMRMLETGRNASSRLSRRALLALAVSAALLVVVLQPAPAQPQADAYLSRLARRPAPTAAEQSLRLGVAWLLRHQDPDGMWRSAEFERRCRGEACAGKGNPRYDVGVTGLALIALVEARDQVDGELVAPAIERGAKALASAQDRDGWIGAHDHQHFVYGHAYATLALARLRAADSARDALDDAIELKGALEKATALIVRARNPYSGWRYSAAPDGDNDASVTSLMEIVLGTALDAGISVDAQAIDQGLAFLDKLTDPESGRTGYQVKGSPPARTMDAVQDWPAENSESLTAAALHARSLHDVKLAQRGDTRAGLGLIRRRPPRWDADGGNDFYYWFHATIALRSAREDGEAQDWKRWQEAVVGALAPNQRRDGDAAGSFDPADPWGAEGGRVYATALNVATLATAARE